MEETFSLRSCYLAVVHWSSRGGWHTPAKWPCDVIADLSPWISDSLHWQMAANPHDAMFGSTVLWMLLRCHIFVRPPSEEVMTQKCTHCWFCWVCRVVKCLLASHHQTHPLSWGSCGCWDSVVCCQKFAWQRAQLSPMKTTVGTHGCTDAVVKGQVAAPGCCQESAGEVWPWRGCKEGVSFERAGLQDRSGVMEPSAALHGCGPPCAAWPRNWRLLPRGLPRNKWM